MKYKAVALIGCLVLLQIVVGCGGTAQRTPAPTLAVEATVEAMAQALAKTMVEATAQAAPTATQVPPTAPSTTTAIPTPTPSPIRPTPTPTPVAPVVPTPIGIWEIFAFTQKALAIEQMRDAMASAAARVAPAFRSDLARAYIDGHSSGTWFEGIRGLKRKLVSLESPDETRAIKDGLIEVYDIEIRSIQRRTRTEASYGELYEIGYLVGFYPDVTKDNYTWWGEAVRSATSDATDWVAAQRLRAEVYEEWYRMLQDHGIDMEIRLPQRRELPSPTEEEVRQAAFEQQEMSDPRGVFRRFLLQLPTFAGSSGIARGFLMDQYDGIWNEYLILKTGTEVSFFDYLQNDQRPTVQQLKQGLQEIYTLLQSVLSDDEGVREIAIREIFGD